MASQIRNFNQYSIQDKTRKMANAKPFWSSFILILGIFVQAWGQNTATSSCGGVLELSSGVLDFSAVGRNGQTPESDFCMWVIKLPVTSQNIQFQLTQIPASSQLNLYSQEGHVAGQFSILPIATLTSANPVNSSIDVNDSSLIAIWTPSRVQNGKEEDSGLLSFKWDSVKVQPGNDQGRDLDLVGGINYVEADQGRFSWVKPGDSQQTLLWVLNSKALGPLELKIETEFEKCDLIDPCLCSYFGVYEVYDNFLRAVSTECSRSSNVQVSDIRPRLVALGFVNPDFRRDTNHVTLSWKEEEPEEGTTQKPSNCPSASGYPKSCSEIQYESGSNSSQLQSCLIYPDGPTGDSLQVLCDFETDGGGWTIIQKRSSGPQDDFNRLWDEYEKGFGSLDGNFWLGLENIRALTKNGDQEVRFDLEDFEGDKGYSKYSRFLIADASDFYRLQISGFYENSTAGDSMTYFNFANNGMMFTTPDKDNDDAGAINCAKLRPSGWWYSFCGYSFINGLYREKGESFMTWDGVIWFSWKGFEISLAKTEMKIRTRNNTTN